MPNLAPIPDQTQNYLDSICAIDMESSINQIYESITLCHAQINILKEVLGGEFISTDNIPIITTALKSLESHIESVQEDLDSFNFEFVGG